MDSSWSPRSASTDARQRHESGQALVEFALIAPLFLLIVVGIIQFGIGLNYWLDLNRLANQGARWAVVNHGWTNCDISTDPATVCTNPTLQDYLKSSRVSGGLDPKVKITFVGTPTVGQPVSVKMTSCYTFLPILDLGNIVLNATATMRIEQTPGRYSAAYNDPTADNPCP